jgi:hypothetical protein
LGVSLLLESEIHLWMTGVPHHCRCIVAGRFLLPNKTCEHGLHGRQFFNADRSIRRADDEMRSQLAVLE